MCIISFTDNNGKCRSERCRWILISLILIDAKMVINAPMHRCETARKNKLINFNIVADIPRTYRVHDAEAKHSGNGPR